MLDLNNLQNYREDNRIEAKQALGGLPESIWETYSAFANAEGGAILLGLLDPQWLIDDLRTILNDPMRVSANILAEEDVQIHQVDGKRIIAITVPKADPSQKPVYIENDPYRGTDRRCGEGDYRCDREEVDAMLRQQSHTCP